MNVKVAGEGSEENEEHDTGNWRRCDTVIRWEKTSLSCVLQLRGKHNM